MSVDELMMYINGGEQNTLAKAPKKSPAETETAETSDRSVTQWTRHSKRA